jgi:SAM-dependent methyltransferase
MVRVDPGSGGGTGPSGGTSRLLDLRDCARPDFTAVHRDMLRLDLEQQPRWFRPILARSRRLKAMTGYDHWSRAWEYPWAVVAAGLGGAGDAGMGAAGSTGAGAGGSGLRGLRTLDVGGGGSPFSIWLATRGHEAWVADPSLDRNASFVFDRDRDLYRNLRAVAKRALFAVAGIHSLWGLPDRGERRGVRYTPDRADALTFPDRHFDRVFSLSVMEHIPVGIWPACMHEFVRVLAPGGRLVITLDMTREEADDRRYRRLVEACPLRLAGDPDYPVPIDPADGQRRHPGHGYETIGLVWSA